MSEDWTREKILELGRAFCRSRILLTATELNLFTKLNQEPRTVNELCRVEGWSTRGLTILLDALTAIGLLSKTEDGHYSTQQSLTGWLGECGEDSLQPMLLHMAHLWRSWSDLTEIVRGGDNFYDFSSPARSDEEVEAFIGAMDVVARKMADTIAGSIDLTRFYRMLDLGGGPGTYTAAFLKKAPQMTATLFDLPRVVDIARKRLTQSGLIDRVQIVEGDYNTDPLPSGQDLVWVSAIIHSNSRNDNRELFKKVYACLDAGGTILIRDHIMDETRTSPADGAIFAVNMLAVTKDGNCYTFDEVKDDLEAAGFHDVRMSRLGERMDQIFSAVK